MVSFIHIGKIVDTNEIGCYEGVILDACCHNIASSDEIWHLVVEMSVLFVTRTHPSNPRIAWYVFFVCTFVTLKSALWMDKPIDMASSNVILVLLELEGK